MTKFSNLCREQAVTVLKLVMLILVDPEVALVSIISNNGEPWVDHAKDRISNFLTNVAWSR